MCVLSDLVQLSNIIKLFTDWKWQPDGKEDSYYDIMVIGMTGSEEVRQEAGPDVIWRPVDAAWLHSIRVWTSHCLYLGLYLDYAYLYLRLYLRGTSALFVSILSSEFKELITMMKARGYSDEKTSGMISIRLV